MSLESSLSRDARIKIGVARAQDILNEAFSPLQPIDTAPKDGSRFWGLCGDDLIAMRWDSDFDAFMASPKHEPLAIMFRHPTHWMKMLPLPEDRISGGSSRSEKSATFRDDPA